MPSLGEYDGSPLLRDSRNSILNILLDYLGCLQSGCFCNVGCVKIGITKIGFKLLSILFLGHSFFKKYDYQFKLFSKALTK